MMNHVFNFTKKNANWLIPTLGIGCILSLVVEYILMFISLGMVDGSTSGLLEAISGLIGFVFIYAVGVFMMIYGHSTGNKRMQNLIVILSCVYIGVTNFISGVSLIFYQSGIDPILYVSYLISFFISLCWLFILYEGGFGYIRGDLERRYSLIGVPMGIISVLYLIQIILIFVTYRSYLADYEGWIYVLSTLTPILFQLDLFVTFIDVHYIGGNNAPRRREKKIDKDDLDIHTY